MTDEATADADTSDGSVASTLNDLGITDSQVLGVSEAGDANGFILDTRSPTWEESLDFAYMSYLTCEDVVSREATWQSIKDDSVSTGASASEAEAMTSYWSDTFCPDIGVDIGSETTTEDGGVDAVTEEESAPTPSITSSRPVKDDPEFKAAISDCESSLEFGLEIDFASDENWGKSGELLISFESRPGLLDTDTSDLECLIPKLGLSSHEYSVLDSMPSGTLAWTSDSGNEWTLNWRDASHPSFYDGELSL